MVKNGKYAAFVNHLYTESDKQLAADEAAVGVSARTSRGAATSGTSILQTQLQATAGMLQSKFLDGEITSDRDRGSPDGPRVTVAASTSRPVPMEMLQTISQLRRILQEIEGASGVRDIGGLPLTLAGTPLLRPGSAPGTPRTDSLDDGLGGIAGTDYRSPR